MAFEENLDTADQSIQNSQPKNEALKRKEKLDLAENCTSKNIKSFVSKKIAGCSKLKIVAGYATAAFLSFLVIRQQFALGLEQQSPSMREVQQSFTKAVHNKTDQLSVGESRLSRPVSIKEDGVPLRHEHQARTRVTQPQNSIQTQFDIISLLNPLSGNYSLDEPEDV